MNSIGYRYTASFNKKPGKTADVTYYSGITLHSNFCKITMILYTIKKKWARLRTPKES